MNPLSSEEMAVLKTELANPKYKGKTVEEIGNMLSDFDMIDNPEPATVDPKPFKATDIETLLSPKSLAKLLSLPLFARIIELADQSANEQIGQYATALAMADPPVITGAERDSILAVISQTEPDPNWDAKIRGPRVVNELFPNHGGWIIEVPAATDEADAMTYHIDFIPEQAITEAIS